MVENLKKNIEKNMNDPRFLEKLDRVVNLLSRPTAHINAVETNSKQNVIGEGQVSPNTFTYAIVTPIPVKKTALSREALRDKSTGEIYDILSQMDQIQSYKDPRLKKLPKLGEVALAEKNVEVHEALPASTNITELSSNQKESLIAINANAAKLRDSVHYGIIAELLRAMLFCELIENQYPDNGMILFKKEIVAWALRYNVHDPYYLPLVEEKRLRELRAFSGLIARIRGYLLGFKLASHASNIEPPSTPPAPKSDASVSEVSVNLAKIKDSSKIRASIFAVQSVFKQIQKEEGKKKDGELKSVRVNLINLENTMNPITEFEGLETSLENLIVQGLDIINQMKIQAHNANYNLETREFGSYVDSPNTDALESIHAHIQKYLKISYKNRNVLDPKFLLVSEIQTSIFHTRFSYGDIVYITGLLPGEKQEIRIKTTETLKSSREASQTIFTSNSETVSKENAKMIERENNSMNSRDNETQQYLDTSFEAGAELSTPVVKAGVEYSADVGNASTNRTNVAEANRTLENNTDKQANTHTTKNDITVTETSKESFEKTDESGQVRTFENRNEAAALLVIMRKILQELTIINHVANMYVVFFDGIAPYKFPISQVIRMLTKYVTDDEERKALIGGIKEGGKILDYRNRLISLIEENDGELRFRYDAYYKILTEMGAVTDEDKANFEQRKVQGCVTSIKDYAIPTAGIGVFPAISSGLAFDDFELTKAQNTLEKQKIELDLLRNQVRALTDMLDHIQKLPDAKRSEEYFRLIKENSAIFEKIMMLGVLNSGNQKPNFGLSITPK